MAETTPCDLHVLSMPPAFALSQDQTLRFIHANHPPDSHPANNQRNELRHEPSQPHSAVTHTTNHRASKAYSTEHASKHPTINQPKQMPKSTRPRISQSYQCKSHTRSHAHTQPTPVGAANISLPYRYKCQGTGTRPRRAALRSIREGRHRRRDRRCQPSVMEPTQESPAQARRGSACGSSR